MNKIKAVIFDVNGVLYIKKKKSILGFGRNEDKSVHEYIADKLGIDLGTWFDAMDSPYADSIIGKLSKKKVIKIIADKLDVSSEKLENILRKAYKKNYYHNRRLLDAARNLKKKGYKLGILSDQWPVSEEYAINKKLMSAFDVFVVSCKAGIRKPDSKIYQIALKKLKIKPSEAIFIDDREWNIEPAEKLGMRGILFRGNISLRKDLKKWGIEI